MGNKEKKIVTTVMWGICAIIGFCVAETWYDIGMTGYMKLFHKDAWDKAVKELSQN